MAVRGPEGRKGEGVRHLKMKEKRVDIENVYRSEHVW
jgi:hypothetical protein